MKKGLNKEVKRIFCAMLAAIMLISIAPLTGMADWLGGVIADAANKQITEYSVGDIVDFGSYPQSKVTDSSLISALNAQGGTWQSYGYMSGSGTSYSDGSAQKSDYMKYCDTSYNGSWYRGVKFTTYRPYCTNYQSTTSTSYTHQYDNGYYINTTYWFKYETLKWRVLDPSTGLVLCENIIDSQPYSETLYFYSNYYSNDYYKDSAHTIYANNYYESSIREWLNDDFYNTAFTSSEKAQINSNITRENKAWDTSDSQYDSRSSKDSITLLTYSDMANTSYGFSSNYSADDVARRAHSSDYAKCQGANTYTGYQTANGEDTSYWWLRSSGSNSTCAGIVWDGGSAGSNYSVSSTSSGVRPAFNFNLESVISSSLPSGDVDPVNVNYVDEETHGTVSVNFKQSWFINDSSVYNQQLAQFTSKFTVLGYDNGSKANLRNALQLIGMDKNNIDIVSAAPKDEVNNFIANRKIAVNGKTYNLVFVGLIGSYHAQWYSNFDPGTGETHQGFNGAMEYVYKRLKDYLKNNGFDKSNTKLLICGHSRGAAAANLLGAKLINSEELAAKENIYTYTFATPNVTSRSDKNDAKYKRIFNFTNPEDFVTKVMPTAWGYGRYGTTFTLPSKTNSNASKYKKYLSNMRTYFSTLRSGDNYKPFTGGETQPTLAVKLLSDFVRNPWMFYNMPYHAGITLMTPYDFFQNSLCHAVSKVATTLEKANMITIASGTLTNPISNPAYKAIIGYFIVNGGINYQFEYSHYAQTYCAYVNTMTEQQIRQKRRCKIGTVNCPVDIEVYDNSTGELVGRIVNNTVDETIAANENSVAMSVDGDSKQYWLPDDGDYTVKLIGNDNGTMDCTTSLVDSDEGELKRANFSDVAITAGKSYSIENITEETDVADIALVGEDGNTVGNTEVLDDKTDNTIEVKTTVDGDGAATGSFNPVKGDYVKVVATPKSGSHFIGWYENDELVSNDSEYSFVAKENRNLVAKFEADWAKIELSDENITVFADETVYVDINSSGKAGSEISCEYGDYDKSIITTSSSGDFSNCTLAINGLSAGTTRIKVYVQVKDTGEVLAEKYINVMVMEKIKNVNSVDIPDITEMNYKESTKLTPNITADDGAKYTVTWSSSDNKIATVDENGNVYAAKKGTATITCTVTDSNGNVVTDTSKVTVKYTFVQILIRIFLLGFLWY